MKLYKRHLLIAVALAAVGIIPAMAQDHLVPEHNPFEGEPEIIAEYNDLLISKFSSAFKSDVVLRAIVIPGTPPYAVSIHRTAEGHLLRKMAAKEHLWQG